MPEDEVVDDRPCLFIPYWPPPPISSGADTGEHRPLPSGVVNYLCVGIETHTPYLPGSDLTVTVRVGNGGGGNAASLALVRVWWAIPGTSFAGLEPSKKVGTELIPLPPRTEYKTTAPMTVRIPASAPGHICLIASVSHPLDPAGAAILPGVDRHWAQHNLCVATTKPQPITFTVTNPFAEARPFQIRAEVAQEVEMPYFAEVTRREVELCDAEFTLLDDHGERATGAGMVEHRVELEPGELRELSVEVALSAQPSRGHAAIFRIVQMEGEEVVGGIAVALTDD